jgi:hypothetical protein
VLRLMGIPVSNFEARRLAATLFEQVSEDALAAAAAIRRGLEDEDDSVSLTSEQQDQILAVLEGTSGRLPELREVLVREREQQITS